MSILLISCSKNNEGNEPMPVEEVIKYEASIPENKLPWPHHNPNILQSAYEHLKENVFVLNNFGQYQCGDTRNECYFHDALDIMLLNGTPIFAIKSGIVVAELGQAPFYKTLIIVDEDNPQLGWSYTHINDIEVQVGEKVQKGQNIGSVRFQGLEHIHLGRVKKLNSWQSFSGFVSIYPNDFFEFTDTQSPIIEQPFYYFQNDTDWQFDSTLNGKVDIVAGIRDPGEYTANRVGNWASYGNRNAVKKLTYKILKEEQVLVEKIAFDFSKLEFRFSQEIDKYAGIVYKFHGLFFEEVPDSWNKFVSHYILTNSPGDPNGELNLDFQDFAWNTAALNESGEPIFPNGIYKIEIIAEDALGNTARASEIAKVLN